MMHNAIAHHLLRYAHPVPEQRRLPHPVHLPLFYCSACSAWCHIGLKYLLGQLRSAEPAASSPSILYTPGLFTGRAAGKPASVSALPGKN